MKKRIGSLVVSGCLLASLTSCSNVDKTWIAEYNGEKINIGVYVQYLMSEYRQLYMKDLNGKLRLVKDEPTEQEKMNATSGNSTSGVNLVGSFSSDEKSKDVSIFKKFAEDEDSGKWIEGEEWVINQAKRDLEEELGIEKRFQELGLELDVDTVSYLESNISKQWDALNEQYGYEKKGVSKESLLRALEVELKREAVFKAYYGKGGTKEVSAEDLRSYLRDNYTQVKYYSFGMEGLKSHEEDKIEKLYNEFLSRAQAGEDFDALVREYSEREYDSGNATDEETKSGYDRNIDNVDETVAIYKNDASNSHFTKEVQEAILAAEYGVVTGYQNVDEYVIFIRQDPSVNEEYIKENEINLLSEMKKDEFEDEAVTWIDGSQVKYNDEAIKKYYSPSKLKLDK